jgi:hypothetical protein
MIIRSNYRSETLFYASLRSEGGAPDVPARLAGDRRSIDLRPKYLSPTLPVHKMLALVQLPNANLALAMAC